MRGVLPAWQLYARMRHDSCAWTAIIATIIEHAVQRAAGHVGLVPEGAGIIGCHEVWCGLYDRGAACAILCRMWLALAQYVSSLFVRGSYCRMPCSPGPEPPKAAAVRAVKQLGGQCARQISTSSSEAGHADQPEQLGRG